jgi:hypothetical protein
MKPRTKNGEAMGLKVGIDYRFGTGYPIVNAMMLEKALSEAPEVYSFQDTNCKSNWAGMDKFPNKNPDHSARLLCITRIAKEPLKHEMTIRVFDGFNLEIPKIFVGLKCEVTFKEIKEEPSDG